MKAIHNNNIIKSFGPTLYSIRQKYKMKAIHNGNHLNNSYPATVFNTSKLQNKSDLLLFIKKYTTTKQATYLKIRLTKATVK